MKRIFLFSALALALAACSNPSGGPGYSPPPLAPDTTIGAYIDDYIAGHPGTGETAANPIPLPVNMDISGGWAVLLSTINSKGKYVALDLSACTGAAEFDPDYTNSTGKDKIVSLILPDGATSIKAGTNSNPTFKDFSALKSVTGGAVTTVGDYAFLGCGALETVSLPAATSIGEDAFAVCTGLTSVNLPAAVSVGEMAFFVCPSLASVSLPAATSIGDGAFSRCTGLTAVDLPAATSIGLYAFEDCTNLITVNIPAAIHIGGEAFAGCAALTAISLPASLTTITGNPFSGCPTITVTVAPANPSYKVDGERLVSKDGATLIGWPAASGAVTLSGITNVANYAFADCTGLTEVTLPVAVSIGYAVFSNCAALETVTLSLATDIGSFAFSGCTSLTTVNLPAAPTIPTYTFAFTGTTANLTVTLGDEVPTVGGSIFLGVTAKSVTVKVPDNEAWSGIISGSPYTGNDTAANWGNGFRGGGWWPGINTDGINSGITLEVQALP
jgi:hypothetical protein